MFNRPSLSTIGTKQSLLKNRDSRIFFDNTASEKLGFRGKCFFEGRLANITTTVLLLPWSLWWQSLVMATVIYGYVIYLLYAHYFTRASSIIDVTLICCELIYLMDFIVHLLHAFWHIVRLHMRIYRRSYLSLSFDVITLIPLTLCRNEEGLELVVIIGRWLGLLRIYRLYNFMKTINAYMHVSRKVIYLIEHITCVLLILHSASCFWYDIHKYLHASRQWSTQGYPSHVGLKRLDYHSYKACWYFCTCRLFNVLFGDSFPLHSIDKWLTSCLMLLGYVVIRYRFIGIIAWEFVVTNSRRYKYVDRCHRMLNYLKLRGAPSWLVDQAERYKETLWNKKDGVLMCEYLNQLPLPLRMELIFDINVDLLHKSLLFKNVDESCLRQVSLLMRHELFLTGQNIWSQNIVKAGMICVKRGIIEMLSDEDDESPIIAFKEGTVLGELSLFYSIPSKVTIKAATYVELQVLRRTDFMRLMLEQPIWREQVREVISTRIENIRQREEAIKDYDKSDSRLLRTRYRPMKVLKDGLENIAEEDSTFVDDSHLYYRDANNMKQKRFTSEYLELYQLAENVTMVDTPPICIRANFPWILEPDTNFTHMCDIIHFAMVLYMCLVCPYDALLSDDISDIVQVLNTILMVGLLLNLYLQVTTAIVDKDVRKETVKEIVEVKMSTLGFYLDLLSVFPMWIFTDTLDAQGETIMKQMATQLPILQVWHLWSYISKWEENFKSNVKVLCLVKFTLFVTMLSYWSGCFLYFIACPRKLCKEGSWMALLVYIETKVFATIIAKHEEPVISSLNFGTSVFTGSGSINISPGPDDLILVNILFVLGSYMSYFFTAKVCSLYILSTQRKLKFKESMRELFYFLSVNRVSDKIKSRVEKFFRVQWYYNHAVSPEELFSNLSDNMKQEVLCVEIVQILLYCPIFQECPRDFLQIVGSKTRTIVLPDNEIVQHAADIGRDMYILQKGYCDILNHTGKVVRTIGPGDNVGLMEMLYGLPKVYTVVTSTNCVLLHIEFSTLVQSWNIFPDVADTINQVLEDPQILYRAKHYENSKPLTSKAEVKANRLTQGIKESFILLNGREYVNAFDKLGIMRLIRYICYVIVPISITPHGMFLKIWCALRILLAVYYVFAVPYDIAVKGSNVLCISNHWIDMILYVDIVIMAYVGYYDERSLLVSHPLYTITHYLKHGFLLDLITVFPIEYLFRIINEESNADPYRINKILQVTRIMGAFSYLEDDIMRVNQAIILIKFLPAAITIVNLSTVVLFSNTCKPIPPANNSYFLEVNCTRNIIMGGSKYDIVYSVKEYVATFYWVFEIIVGCGCTPISTMNSMGSWMIMALQLLGFIYFAFMFGSVASSRSASARSLLDHNEKINDLANFLYQENVEPALYAKTLEYFEYVWKRTNGNNPQLICRRLNSVLMEDTLVFMYERSLREVPLFGKVERSFIRVITRHLHEMYFLKGETVIQYKDVQPYIYIIYKGKVDVLSSYNEMITCMGPGGMFGNFSGSKSRSEVTVYASRSLDLLVIPSQDFFNLIKYYPKLKEPLNKAFQMSKDYVLPISMDMNVAEDSSSDDMSADNSGDDLRSVPSMNDSRSGSGRFYESGAAISLSLRSSQSNISQSKSAASQLTLHNEIHPYNLFRPGTWLFQIFGYFVCSMAVSNYVLISYELVTLNNCYVFSWLHTIFDIVFYVKIYIRIHQGYVNKRGCYIGEPARCRGEYFKSKLRVWTDILVNFPLEFFAFCFPQPATAMHFWRINKLFRLKYLWEFNSITSSQLTNNITSLQSTMTIFVVILMFHTFTCVWLLASILITPVSIIRTVKLHLIDEDTTPQVWDYTTSFYVVVSELSASGGDEFLIDDILSTTILAICLLFGKILASVIIATSVQVAYSSQNALVNYEKKTNQLIDVLKNQGLSSYQLKKLRKYIRQLWVSERGRQLPALLAQTPYVRRCDLMSAMFGHHLRNCFLFADTGQSFLRQLSALLEYNVYFPGNYIAVENDSEPKMFWVDFGTVAVVSVRSDLTEVTYELLGPGDVFGILQGMTRGLLHRFSYRAETKVNILSLTLDSWNDLLSFFPESKTIIMERAEVLYANI